MSEKLTVFDCETTGLHPWHGDRPFSIAISDEEGKTKYLQAKVNPFTREVTWKQSQIDYLNKRLSTNSIKVGHNIKLDIRMLSFIGVTVKGEIHDTFIMARIFNTLENRYGLKLLANKYAGFPVDDETKLQETVIKCRRIGKKLGWLIADGDKFGTEPQKADYWLPETLANSRNLNLDEDSLLWIHENLNDLTTVCKEYAIKDVIRTILLFKFYSNRFNEDEYLKNTYGREIELWPIVYDMETRGISISKAINKEELINHKNKSKKLLSKIKNMVNDDDFDPNSWRQLSQAIYSPPPKGFGLPVKQYTKSGTASTDWKALRPHQNHIFVQSVLSYRAATKAVSTFFEKYNFLAVKENKYDIIHMSLDQAGALTGRFSCRDPNLQQASSVNSGKGIEPAPARKPFGPRDGYRWYCFDYAQQEIRIFADVGNISSMLNIINDGRDINTENANKAWGGKNNEYALIAASYALELGSLEPSSAKIKEVWDELGWTKNVARFGTTSSTALKVADDWLSKFNYDIIKAEKSIDKSSTRTRAKMIIFAKIYGGGASAVSDLLYCSEEEAREFMNHFDYIFPEIPLYMSYLTKKARSDRYIITKYGRKLRVDPEFSYRAVNYMVQGTAADMMKESMIKCHKLIKNTGLDAHILLTIHDELIFEIRKDHSYLWLLRQIQKTMEDHEGRLRVPMVVECKRCDVTWNEKKDVELGVK